MSLRSWFSARIASKADLGELRTEMNGRFDRVDERLDRLEFAVNQTHLKRLEDLEDDVRLIKTKIGIR